jgi:glycosyltransferase involved in cell wall biosynthesis
MSSMLVYSAQMEAVGGIESHVLELCLRFAQAGQEVTLMSSRFESSRGTEARLREAGVELIVNRGPWMTATPLRKWLWTLLALARLRRRHFSVVYTNGQGRNPATLHGWFRGKTRLVHHHHTACDDTDVAMWPPRYGAAMKRADSLVVCADFIRQRMSMILGRSDIDVVYCFSNDPGEITAGDRTVDAPVVFGYYGRLIPEKGIDWIVRLSQDSRLQAIRWKIWGPEAAYGARDFAKLRNVDYCGAFPPESGSRRALSQMDCYCLFSTHPEGIPVSLLEVQAAGKPWIATRQGGIPELAHDPASCMLISLDNYDEVVVACLQMAGKIRDGLVAGSRQRTFYKSRFGVEVLLDRWSMLLFAPRAGVPRPQLL